MLQENKVCDGADWFEHDFQHIATNPDLYGCMPRFHRKQWEFIKIWMVLTNRNMLTNTKKGLSMGSGREPLLFSLLPYVAELHATDLYNKSAWKLSGAKGNPKQFVLDRPGANTNKAEKLHVKDMDMRKITYEDETFDFAYSSCAVEHIGTHKDFLDHFNEVYRVLKPGGIYVFTTEFGFMEKSAGIPGHWCFGTEEISTLFNEIKFNVNPEVDCTISKHLVNAPTHISTISANMVPTLPAFKATYPHIILWPKNSTSHCFTSTSFVLIKEPRKDLIKFNFKNMKESIAFLKGFKL